MGAPSGQEAAQTRHRSTCWSPEDSDTALIRRGRRARALAARDRRAGPPGRPWRARGPSGHRRTPRAMRRVPQTRLQHALCGSSHLQTLGDAGPANGPFVVSRVADFSLSIVSAGGWAAKRSNGVGAMAAIARPLRQTGISSHASWCDQTDGHMCRSQRHDLPREAERRPARAIVPVGRVTRSIASAVTRTMVIHRRPSAVTCHASTLTGGGTRTLAFDRRRPTAGDSPTFASQPRECIGLAASLSCDCCLARERAPGVRERGGAPAGVGYRARPALACIIGARLAWMVEMISSVLIPSR